MTEEGRSCDILYSVNNINYIFLSHFFLYLHSLMEQKMSTYLVIQDDLDLKRKFFISYVYNWGST